MDYFLLDSSVALLRVRHVYSKDDAAPFSLPVSFNLTDYFPNIASIQETQLTGVQPPSFVDSRLKWNVANEIVMNRRGRKATVKTTEKASSFPITLNPMQIRTFIVDLN